MRVPSPLRALGLSHRWAAALLVGPAAWAAGALLARAPGVVEAVWGERLSRWFAMAVGTLTGVAPFSVAEVGGALLGMGLLGVAIRAAVDKGGGRTGLLRLAGRGLVVGLAAASIGYAVFLLVWGMGARRRPLDETLGYPPGHADVDDLAALYAELVAQSNTLRAQVPSVEGVAAPLGPPEDVLARAVTTYTAAGEAWPLLAGRYAPPKPVIVSPLMSAVGILGIYVPFTGEANVNLDGPAFAMPFSACHEMAHQRGFTREDEANFVAYLVARASPHIDFRYAASFMAQVYTAGALGKVDHARWQELRKGVAPEVLADAEAYWTWVAGTRTVAADVTSAVNDTYLRSQGSSGVESYGEIVDLLLAERRARTGG